MLIFFFGLMRRQRNQFRELQGKEETEEESYKKWGSGILFV
jgi:hypothetical protein